MEREMLLSEIDGNKSISRRLTLRGFEVAE